MQFPLAFITSSSGGFFFLSLLLFCMNICNMILCQFLCLRLMPHPFPNTLCVMEGGMGGAHPWKVCVAGSCDTGFSSTKERHLWEIIRQMGRRSQGISALLSTLGSPPEGSSAPWLQLCRDRPPAPTAARKLWLYASAGAPVASCSCVPLNASPTPFLLSKLFRHLY